MMLLLDLIPSLSYIRPELLIFVVTTLAYALVLNSTRTAVLVSLLIDLFLTVVYTPVLLTPCKDSHNGSEAASDETLSLTLLTLVRLLTTSSCVYILYLFSLRLLWQLRCSLYDFSKGLRAIGRVL